MQIQLGDVFHLHCFTCQTPKPKFFVVALLAPLRFFVINSNATPFQLTVPEVLATLAPILQRENAFLSHDSLIGCNALFAEYSENELATEIAANPKVYRGSIGPLARAAIGAALVGNRQLPRKYIAGLQADWPP